MVHRQHLMIFPTYYPPVFTDWWMDDWITHVYGKGRTQWGPFEVEHPVIGQSRYSVDYRRKASLQKELAKGAKAIEAWVRQHRKHDL